MAEWNLQQPGGTAVCQEKIKGRQDVGKGGNRFVFILPGRRDQAPLKRLELSPTRLA